MNQTIKAGVEFLRGGKQCYIAQLRQVHGKMEIHSDDGDIAILSPEAFRREVVDGDIQMLVPGSDGVLHPVSSNWMEREGKCARNARNRRTQLLNYVDSELKRGTHLNRILDDIKTYCHVKDLGDPANARYGTGAGWQKDINQRCHLPGTVVAIGTKDLMKFCSRASRRSSTPRSSGLADSL